MSSAYERKKSMANQNSLRTITWPYLAANVLPCKRHAPGAGHCQRLRVSGALFVVMAASLRWLSAESIIVATVRRIFNDDPLLRLCGSWCPISSTITPLFFIIHEGPTPHGATKKLEASCGIPNMNERVRRLNKQLSR